MLVKASFIQASILPQRVGLGCLYTMDPLSRTRYEVRQSPDFPYSHGHGIKRPKGLRCDEIMFSAFLCNSRAKSWDRAYTFLPGTAIPL